LVQTVAADVAAAVAKVKSASRSTTLDKDAKAGFNKEAAKQQKRYLALKEQVKMDDDKKAAAIELAKEKEQEAIDKRNAFKLKPKETLAIVQKVKKLASYVKVAGDANKTKQNKAASLVKAQEYMREERRKRDKLKKVMDGAKPDDGTVTKAYNDAKIAFYKQKAVYEQINKLVANAGASSAKAAEETDKARFVRAIDEDEQEELDEEIKKRIDAMKGKDKDAAKKARLLLQKLEEDAQFLVAMGKKKKNRKPTDKNKQRYYDALTVYNYISNATGPKSPAKLAEKQRKVKAAFEKARNELAGRLAKAKSAKQVANALKNATKGNVKAEIYNTLKDARTNADMKAVLALCAKDKKMARKLAIALLNAKDQDAAAGAFAEIKQLAITQGTTDPEVILKAKVDALVSRYVMKGELEMSNIKDTFNKAAVAAKTQKEVDAAQDTAGKNAEKARAAITKALETATRKLSGNYDLSKAIAAINTSLGAGRAEVRLNHARKTAQLASRDFDVEMKKKLTGAKTET